MPDQSKPAKLTLECAPRKHDGPIDYTPRPTGEPIDYAKAFDRVMARYPKIMARLAQ